MKKRIIPIRQLVSVLLALLCISCQSLSQEPALIVPANFVWSEPPIIQAKNLQPLATYRLEVERALFSSDTTHQNSSLTYVADENGAINTALYPDETDESLSPYLSF